MNDSWTELRDRLSRAVASLEGLADRADPIALDHLDGKIQGVKLAIGYMDEIIRPSLRRDLPA